MNIDVIGKRGEDSRGKRVQVEFKLGGISASDLTVTASILGDNHRAKESAYWDNVVGAFERGGPMILETRYEGEIKIYNEEIIDLFVALVNKSKKSDEFKAIAAAVVSELRRKKGRQNYVIK